METVLNKYSGGFAKGFAQLQIRAVTQARTEIMNALNIAPDNKVTFREYLIGKREPKASKAQKIEKIFNAYQIFDIWGSDCSIDEVKIRWKH